MEALYIFLDAIILAILAFGIYLWFAVIRQSH